MSGEKYRKNCALGKLKEIRLSNSSRPDIATLLSERILVRPDFRNLIFELETAVARSVLAHESIKDLDRHLKPAMRFADILSYSANPLHRNQAYSIIALFQELKDQSQLDEKHSELLDSYSEAILSALGNFPALNKLNTAVDHFRYALPVERVLTTEIKKIQQKTDDGKYVLTDGQYKVAQDLRNHSFYSFSGATSLGKSFVIKDFVRAEVAEESFEGKCVVFLVPTNALVAQTARDLRRDLGDVKGINVATHPVQPKLILKNYRASIYVFTPERLIRYLSTRERKIELLVVDEAHRIVAAKDSRTPLYYYAIEQTLRVYASKLIFSSPSLSNPDLFLQLFGKSPEGNLVVSERTVAQQRFFLDCMKQEAYYLPSLDGNKLEKIQAVDGFKSTPWQSIEYWAHGSKSLIYLNTPSKVVDFARSYDPPEEVKLNARARTLIEIVKDQVHPDYYLIDALCNGVAFHHGRMPVAIREEIESVFKEPDSGINFLVCTSTLLAGVNLPARNIFILTDKHGNGRDMSKLDFENLAGRAGRLTQDFKGNIFCVKINKGEWKDPRAAMRPGELQSVSTFLLERNKRKRKQYTDIENILLEKPVARNLSAQEIEAAERYAAILTIQHLSNDVSLLTENFKQRATNAEKALKFLDEELGVKLDVLRHSPEFSPIIQDHVRKELTRLQAPIVIASVDEISFSSVLSVLTELSRLYNWRERETRGRAPMFWRNVNIAGFEQRLSYWANLVFQWVTGHSIRSVIRSSLAYYEKKARIVIPDYSRPKGKSPFVETEFSIDSKEHVNKVIDDTLNDIDYGVCFRILSYLRNYHHLCSQVFGPDEAGLDLSILIEFGSANQTTIELQQMGYSREVSAELTVKASECLTVDRGGSIEDIAVVDIINDQTISDRAKQETTEIFPNGCLGMQKNRD